jgi:dienelactone hydrolase
MTDVLLFHHAHGLTPGVLAFADELRAAGHRVVVPDLYGGVTFDALQAGIEHAEAAREQSSSTPACLSSTSGPGHRASRSRST